MARHYKPMSPAQRDAATERRIAALEALGIRPREAIPMREPGRFLLDFNGVTQDVELRPDRRHCWRWYAVLEGEVIAHGGLDVIFRELQKRRAPMLGERNLQ